MKHYIKLKVIATFSDEEAGLQVNYDDQGDSWGILEDGKLCRCNENGVIVDKIWNVRQIAGTLRWEWYDHVLCQRWNELDYRLCKFLNKGIADRILLGEDK